MFESLLADLLNRFLGDFIENLEASQLNLGMWGGKFYPKSYNIYVLFQAM